MTTIGVDEHVCRHTRFGDNDVTVIIDLTPVRAKTGPARLLDMVEGRARAVFRQWLAERPGEWSKRIEVVGMDGFAGLRTAAAEELPDATPVMDSFHVVRLTRDALDVCRRRVQQDLFGRRGMRMPRSARHAAPSTPVTACSPAGRGPDARRCPLSRSLSRSK
ncbi:hypothetical protein GCM10022230_01920 [Pseudoclavibacter caeni]